MKTSNKLLLGAFIVIVLSMTAFLGAARYYSVEHEWVTNDAPSPPSPPEAPGVPE